MMTKRKNFETWKKMRIAICVAITASFAFIFSGAMAGEKNMETNGLQEDSEPENMTGEQMLNWVRQQTNISGEILESVQRMLESARFEKDTIKMTCLDDKVTQIQVSYRGAEERKETLTISVNANDMVSAKQIVSILKIYFSRIMGLSSEAENCLGESDVVLGRTESTTSISGDITSEEPADEISEDFGINQPTHLSAFM